MSPKCVVSSQSQGHGEGDLYGMGKQVKKTWRGEDLGKLPGGLIFNGCVWGQNNIQSTEIKAPGRTRGKQGVSWAGKVKGEVGRGGEVGNSSACYWEVKKTPWTHQCGPCCSLTGIILEESWPSNPVGSDLGGSSWWENGNHATRRLSLKRKRKRVIGGGWMAILHFVFKCLMLEYVYEPLEKFWK